MFSSNFSLAAAACHSSSKLGKVTAFVVLSGFVLT